ncbi:family 16 glycoside hydrolase [Thermogemmatispora sp.]|uniref:family 16 glycoside hydrolase n=1 Tax=Thermogemmatispora sp. TaxID=1968838 RepID=UPI0035E43456
METANPDRFCPICSRQLGPYELFCGNCGTYVASSPAALPTTPRRESGQSATASPAPNRAADWSASTWSAASPPAAPSWPTPASGFSERAAPFPPPSPLAVPALPARQPVSRWQRLPLLVLIIGSVLALVLLGSVLVLLVSPHNPSASSSNRVVASPSPSPDVLLQARPDVTPLFSDNFADNSKGWDTTGGPGFSKTIANHALTMTDRNHRILVAPLPVQHTFSDFQITVDMTLQSGDSNDSMGIYMRGDDQLANDYRVDIFGDATYAISKEVTGLDGNTQVRILSGIGSNQAIKPLGQQNEVTVIIKGNRIVLGVNGHLIASVTDNSYTSGMIALFVSNGSSSPAATGAITSVTVYPAPAQLP